MTEPTRIQNEPLSEKSGYLTLVRSWYQSRGGVGDTWYLGEDGCVHFTGDQR